MPVLNLIAVLLAGVASVAIGAPRDEPQIVLFDHGRRVPVARSDPSFDALRLGAEAAVRSASIAFMSPPTNEASIRSLRHTALVLEVRYPAPITLRTRIVPPESDGRLKSGFGAHIEVTTDRLLIPLDGVNALEGTQVYHGRGGYDVRHAAAGPVVAPDPPWRLLSVARHVIANRRVPITRPSAERK